ncbi:tRNA (adenosine(37)-N6)-threonylcarbamoyltransferase complex dimerization subunit type 1 TsaB [Fulvivirga lutimaris]|uniref:tRNA (adenosine(37)-N6)-threonylcarbamoyltransferase complex dimerization subunit type 1 TsaB n=1 Tax=Fulvivirga lutimaris TaxID=1819566 RepID=UPI0012BC634B|nr:tRNA (adenosine(37)-N6)-threonylcarbamoyltransferase complex dimerization subunit type 1 TsaB [Fulvivirga lutimaris]MTI38102.1 tRNA (adenosine(37)-N6)-threonylcarbamoyltransferase complex dimerization subunit type 1 TsaB [Fulvivirga lutimaris]
MSLILSIETSTPVCSLAIHNNGQLLAKELIQKEQSHSSTLNPAIDHLLSICDLSLANISAIAVSKGPGSYTGLRIGTSTAKGLCYALNIPLIAVNTLEAMAHNVARFNLNSAMLCPMLDARRMEVYAMLLDASFKVVEETRPVILDHESYSQYLNASPVLFFGNGAEKVKKVTDNPNATVLDGVIPDAQYIGELAFEKFRKKEFEDVAYFEPFYLKEFMATKPKSML